MTTEEYEREKYRALWRDGKYRGPNAVPFADELSGVVFGNCLDIGCGDCATMDRLNESPVVRCVGLDIVTEQCPGGRVVYAGEAWTMPFADKQFDFTLSTDVLEHIPPDYITQTLYEIARVTKRATYHYISTWPAVTTYEGKQVHLTVRDADWWRAMFKEYCGVEHVLKLW